MHSVKLRSDIYNRWINYFHPDTLLLFDLNISPRVDGQATEKLAIKSVFLKQEEEGAAVWCWSWGGGERRLALAEQCGYAEGQWGRRRPGYWEGFDVMRKFSLNCVCRASKVSFRTEWHGKVSEWVSDRAVSPGLWRDFTCLFPLPALHRQPPQATKMMAGATQQYVANTKNSKRPHECRFVEVRSRRKT